MSKHLGNTLEPIPLMDRHGADAVRWFMAGVARPGRPAGRPRHHPGGGGRKTLLTYWNTVSFQALYARTGCWTPSASDPPRPSAPLLDRWLLSELNTLVGDVDRALEAYDTQRAARRSPRSWTTCRNWYVRRSPAAVLGTRSPALPRCTRRWRRSPG